VEYKYSVGASEYSNDDTQYLEDSSLLRRIHRQLKKLEQCGSGRLLKKQKSQSTSATKATMGNELTSPLPEETFRWWTENSYSSQNLL
jgi:hypothetical protein